MMDWLVLAAAEPNYLLGERLYDAVGCLIVFIAGVGILTKTEYRLFGWLFVAASLFWAYLTFQDLLGM